MINRQSNPAIQPAILRCTTALTLFLTAFFCSPALHAQRAGDALDQVRLHKKLIIATDATYPPFEYKDGGKLMGFDVDLGNEIARRMGVKAEWLPLEWTAVLGSLEAHKADLILSGMTITEERKKKGYTFSRPYFLSGQSIARRTEDNSINTLNDLKQKTVSVQDETTGMYAVQKIGVPSNHIMKFDQLPEALTDVRNHKSDAAVADMPALKRLIRMSFGDMQLVGGIIKDEYVGAAARRGEDRLAQAVNEALAQMMTDGTYAAIYKKWINEPVTTRMLGKLDAVRDEGSVKVKDAEEILGSAPPAETGTGKGANAPGIKIRWELLWNARKLLLDGAKITLIVTFFTLLLGAAAGLFIALARLSAPPPIRALMVFYVEIVRGTPLLMQIYAIYFVLPAFGFSFDNPIKAGIAALTFNAAAYIAEIFRAGIQSIDVGQMEAARALGLDYRGAMRWVILPQTLRRVLPPLTNEAVALLKDSSLVSVISVTELMRVGKEVAANTAAPTTLYLGVAAIYLVMTLPLTSLVRKLEQAWQTDAGAGARSGRKQKGA